MFRKAQLCVVALLTAACGAAPEVDRLLIGGVVHAPDGVRAAGVAIAEGRIVALVAPPDVPVWAERAAEVVDLGGAHVFPGLTETHGHLLGHGAALEQVDLVGTGSVAEVVERVRAAAAQVPAGSWIRGRGWDQNDWTEREFPTHDALSAALPDHPVALSRVDGHATWTNARGLAAAAIDATTPDPPGGRILRGPGGAPTGVLVDTAEALLERAIPAPTLADLERRALLGCRSLAALGFTEIHDAGVGPDTLAVLRRLAGEGRLPIRIYAMLDGGDDALLATELAAGPGTTPGGMLAVRAVKLYADGALGSRGALLSSPYADEPETRGLEVTSETELAERVGRVGRAGFQPCIHAIGDAAVTRVLDVYERELGAQAAVLRARIEHAQIVRPADLPRFAALGVIAAVQPTHCTSDMPWAPDRLGSERIPWAYRWRSLKDAGARLALGSDVPVESADPRLGIWAAVTRQAPDGHPPGGWNAAEALSPAEAIAGYTTWAAYAGFEEAWRGVLASGYAADLTIVDADLSASPEVAREATVVRTVVAGRDAFVAADGGR